MALSAEEAAVNTAAIAYITAVEALQAAYVTADAGDAIQFVPVDIGDGVSGNSRSNNDTVVTTSFSQRVSIPLVKDGEFPLQIPGGNDGSLVPLVWMVTNQSNDLS